MTDRTADLLPPHRRRDLVAGFAPGAVQAVGAFAAVIVAFAMGCNWALAGGRLFLGKGEATWIVLGLTLVQFLATVRVGREVRALEGAYVPGSYWALSVVQFVWMASLAWYSHPVIGLACAFLYYAGALNDVRYFHASTPFRALHVLTWPLLLVLLFVVDAFGGDGLLHRWRANPAEVAAIGWFCLMVAITVQIVVAVVGKQAGELDLERARIVALEKERALAEQERDLVGRTNALLLRGLTVGQFSHDLRSPLQMIDFTVDELDAHVTGDAGHRLVRELKAWSREVGRMTRDMATALRRGDPVRELPVETVVSEGRTEAEAMLKARGERLEPPVIDLAPGTVWATDGHATTLGNILTNAATLQPGLRIEVTGRATDPAFYRLAIRDHGVEPADRAATIARIKQAFHAQTSDEAAASPDEPELQRGYGVALLLGRLLVIRSGGWLDVEAPPEGRGVTIVLHLPRRAPGSIPPEAYAALATAG